jgi:hypothetical protein
MVLMTDAVREAMADEAVRDGRSRRVLREAADELAKRLAKRHGVRESRFCRTVVLCAEYACGDVTLAQAHRDLPERIAFRIRHRYRNVEFDREQLAELSNVLMLLVAFERAGWCRMNARVRLDPAGTHTGGRGGYTGSD